MCTPCNTTSVSSFAFSILAKGLNRYAVIGMCFMYAMQIGTEYCGYFM